MIRKALILAAGKGTRMRELTHEKPKPMLQVQGKPILEHIIGGLRDEGGIEEFFIVIGYHGDYIQNYFGHGSRFGVSITYGMQTVQDGTGKAPELAKEWIGEEPFVFSYGDILVPAPEYRLFIDAFHSDGLIALKDGQDLKNGGAVLLNDRKEMVDLIEKGQFQTPPPNAYYNAGIYALTPKIFEYTSKLEKSPRGEYEFTDALKASVKAGGKIEGHFIQTEWADVRDPEILSQLNEKKS
ncbi:MAG: sugar phosphate nucleotidyltransferase [Verrucomicrobiota bacterium]